MSIFSRCEPSEFAEPARRGAAPRRTRTAVETGGLWKALRGFAEDVGILVRYAAGVDYYDRGRTDRRAGP